MEKIDALCKLLAKVEAGGSIDRESIGKTGMCKTATINAFKSAYNGSLDAAKALHGAVLPGWSWSARNSGWASIWSPSYETLTWEAGDKVTTDVLSGQRLVGDAPANPARAWLIAILKALIAMEEATP